MSYKYNDDTLIHSVGFNPMKIEGILKYGIVSSDYAKKNNILYSKNYNFLLDDKMLSKVANKDINKDIELGNNENIYLVRSLYISDDKLSAYNMYTKHGISFLVEDMPFIYDKNKEIIKRSDEVIVKDYIPKDNIKAIMIPEEYKDKRLNEVNMLPSNILNYKLIISNIKDLIIYLKKYNYNIDDSELNYLLNDLSIAKDSVNSLSKDNPDYNDALLDYKDIINDINNILSDEVYICFSKLLGKDATVMDMISFINSKYNNMDIIYLDSRAKTK